MDIKWLGFVFLLILPVIVVSCASGNGSTISETVLDQQALVEGTTPAPADQPVFPPSPTTKPSQLEAIDSTWNQYTSFRLGITLLVPRLMYRHDAGCSWSEGDGDSSFRPQGGLMPVAVVEEEDRVTVTSRYLVELTEPTRIPSGAGYVTRFGGCEWHTAAPETLAVHELTSYKWVIMVRDIEGDEDLDTMIDDYFGPCYSTGEMEYLADRDIYRLRIIGDGLAMEDSSCPVNFAYTFLVSSKEGKAAVWYQGQSYHFPVNSQYDAVYDQEMQQSFTFLEN